MTDYCVLLVSTGTCPMDAAWTPLIIDGRYTTNEEIMLGKSGHHIDIQGTDKAHVIAECSNRGHCDRTTGVCVCMQGFSGLGCQRSKLPPVRCVSCCLDMFALLESISPTAVFGLIKEKAIVAAI